MGQLRCRLTESNRRPIHYKGNDPGAFIYYGQQHEP